MPVEISTLALGRRFAPCEETKMGEAVTVRCQELSHMRVTLNIRRINSADVINAAVEDERKGKSNWSRKGKHKLTLCICVFKDSVVLKVAEKDSILEYCENTLERSWLWLINVMDTVEGQLHRGRHFDTKVVWH